MNLTKRLCLSLLSISLSSLLLSTTAQAQPGKTTLVFVPTSSPGFIRNFNPENNNRLETAFDFVYETLVIFNGYDSNQMYYRLATQITYSDDLRFLTIDLREGVKWSDGEAFDADDLIFTLDLLKRHPEIDDNALMVDFFTGVEKLSPHRVRIQLKEPDSMAIYELQGLFILPEHAWKDIKDPALFPNENPIGTGPFTQVERFADNGYTLCRNPHYWAAADLKIDCLKVPQLQDAAYTIQAQRGELDWFGASMMETEKLYVAKDRQHHKYWYPPQDTIALYPYFASQNPGLKEAFNSLPFRQALSMAVDRPAILEFASTAATAIDNPAGIGKIQSAWASEEVKKSYGKYMAHNPKEAKALLDSAGFKDSNRDGLRESPSGKAIHLVIDVPSGWPDWTSAAQIITEGFKEVGISSSMRVVEFADIMQRTRIIGKANFDLSLSFSALGVTPYEYFSRNFRTSYQDHCNGNTTQGWFAIARYCNPAIDTHLNGFKSTADRDLRQQHLNKVQELVAADIPTIVLFSNPTWYQYNTKRFKGWWTAENNKGNPATHEGNRNRLLLLLDLEPI